MNRSNNVMNLFILSPFYLFILDVTRLRVYYNYREKRNKGQLMIFHYQENPFHGSSVKRVDNDSEWQFHLELMGEIEKGLGDFNAEHKEIVHNCIMTDILVSY